MTTLTPVRPATYAPYLAAAIAGYAQGNTRAGRQALGARTFTLHF
jgi:hypothetical protein